MRLNKGKYESEATSSNIAFSSNGKWPMPLRLLKPLAQPGDQGAGDILARVVGPIGGDAFKKWYKITFGVDCGCGNRQEVLNKRWPL